MTIYLVVFFSLLISVIGRLKLNSFICFSTCLVFAALIGFRGETVGTDTVDYMIMYNGFKDGYNGYPEPIYGYIGYWGQMFGLSFKYFQFLLFLFCLLFVFRLAKKQMHINMMSIYLLYSLFYICYAMNINREILACFIVLCGYLYLSHITIKNRVIFVFFLLIASGFHLSALFLLPVTFIDKARFSQNVTKWIIIFSLMIGMSISIESFLPFVGKYGDTLLEDVNYRDASKILKGIFLSVFFMIEYFYIVKVVRRDFLNNIYLKIYALGLIVNNLFIKQNYGLRFFIYFNIVQVLLLPLVVNNCITNKRKIEVMLSLYLGIYFLVMIFINSADVVPYVI